MHHGRMTAPTAPLPGLPEPLLPGSVDAYVVTDVPVCTPETTAGVLHAMLVGTR